MKKDLGLLLVHGMGSNKDGFEKPLIEKLEKELGSDFTHLEYKAVNYSTLIQKNQDDFLKRMGKVGGKLMMKFRRFFISSLGDNVTAKYQGDNYKYIMNQITTGYYSLRDKLPKGAPIIIYAHSFGTEMTSCWLHDQQKAKADLSQVKILITTGSPIAAFTVGLNHKKIIAIEKTCDDFEWLNFYNERDPICTPLRPISLTYSMIVNDIKVNKGIMFFGHSKYVEDKRVYRRLAQKIRDLIN